uniref:Uncharacterized protein n=1 Tax=Kalanchoe fedtschenkoi TaxID=63787 RepID=A0A7N0T5U7_KALFE
MEGSAQESELFLQWGNRKRNRCARISNKDSHSNPSDSRRPANTPRLLTRDEENKSSALRSAARKSSSSSPENYYTTRGSVMNGAGEQQQQHQQKKNKKISNTDCNGAGVESNKAVWPKLFLGLSNKEKEEDFMAMKGCKPPHRPKKRPKGIQRSVLLVCPGGWLTDMCQERYEVREKKSSKKRPRGLKAMGSLESDSD